MTIKYEHLVDGTAFEAVEFNTRFTGVAEGINDLSVGDLNLGALRYNHLPCMLGPAGESEGTLTDSWNSATGGLTGAFSVNLHATTGLSTVTSIRAFTQDLVDPDRIVSCNVATIKTIDGVAGTFPRYKLSSFGDVNAVLLLGNMNIKRWAKRIGTTDPWDLNEDAMAVEAAFRVQWKKEEVFGDDIQFTVLDKTRRQLSPRLTIGRAGYSREGLAAYAGVSRTETSPILLTTHASFNDPAVPGAYGSILLYTSDTGHGTISVEEAFPGLWAELNDTDKPNNLVFFFDRTGPTVISFGADKLPDHGALIDKAKTADNGIGGTAARNQIWIQSDQLSEVRTDDFKNTTTWKNQTLDTSHWYIYKLGEPDSQDGVPFIDDLWTNQDLPIRSVLLPSDLSDNAEIVQIDLVATLVGGMVSDVRGQRHTVFVTKANITALPIQAKVTT